MKDRLSERSFDEMLGRALRASPESAKGGPADFTSKTLRQIRQAEECRILARVVLQERLALAGCIALIAAAVLAPMFLTDTLAGALQDTAACLTDQGRTFVDKIPPGIDGGLHALLARWRLCAVIGAVMSFAGYSFVGLFVGDRLRMA